MRKRFVYSPQVSFVPFPEDMLPEGFRYPEGYLEHSRGLSYPAQFRWWFTDSTDVTAQDLEYGRTLMDQPGSALAGIDPIPFARDFEWCAFFDGSDRSGDPPVVVAHLGDTSRSASYENFDAWLAVARA